MTKPFVQVGEILAGKYRVEKILGIGGMGMVVSVMHLELDQRVALKFMRPESAGSSSAMDRFIREARSAVKLRSEHVCRVMDVGRLEDGSPYIAMELLEGDDFSRVLSKRGPLPAGEAVDYVLQAIEGVAEAHANGIIHRDLKPGNLFIGVDNDGSPLVKVLDFGISKSSSAIGGITKTGDVIGSPAYMAPEQMASAKDVDVRADIWAIGVILYQAMSRRLPFEGDNLAALCVSVTNDTPTPLDGLVKVAAELSAAVMRCLEKKKEDRWPDVGALAAAIAPFGGAEATASARRIANVLKRPSAIAQRAAEALAQTVPPTADVSAPPIDPAGATAATGSASPVALAATGGAAPVAALGGAASIGGPSPKVAAGINTTLTEAGGGESLRETKPPPRRSRALAAGIVGLATASVITVVAISAGRETRSRTQPASTTESGSAPTTQADPPKESALETPDAAITVATPETGSGSALGSSGSAIAHTPTKGTTQVKKIRPSGGTGSGSGSAATSTTKTTFGTPGLGSGSGSPTTTTGSGRATFSGMTLKPGGTWDGSGSGSAKK